MEPKKLTREQKIEYFGMALTIAGVQFNEPNLLELLVDIYDPIVENGGKIGLDEIMDIKNNWIKNKQQNEPIGKDTPPEKANRGPEDNKGTASAPETGKE